MDVVSMLALRICSWVKTSMHRSGSGLRDKFGLTSKSPISAKQYRVWSLAKVKDACKLWRQDLEMTRIIERRKEKPLWGVNPKLQVRVPLILARLIALLQERVRLQENILARTATMKPAKVSRKRKRTKMRLRPPQITLISYWSN